MMAIDVSNSQQEEECPSLVEVYDGEDTGTSNATSSVPPPPEPVESSIGSKRQLKKQVLREKRERKKDQKKIQRHEDALQEITSSLRSVLADLLGLPLDALSEKEALEEHLCTAFGIASRYEKLPLSFGSQPEEGIEVLRTALLRSAKYNAKFLPQEYSLLHKAWALLGGNCDRAGVVDFGAGNANCGVLAAALFGLCVICVERESPRPELRAETQLPKNLQHLVVRVESDIEDFSPDVFSEIAAKHGLRRIVLMAKHPCGIGVDRSIDCAARLMEGSASVEGACAEDRPEIVGMVMATCCMHKLSSENRGVTRVPEYCGFYAADLPGQCQSQALQDSVELLSRCSAWRTTSQNEGIEDVTQQKIAYAELFEDALQSARLRRLRHIFSDAEEVRFAPLTCTLQDRCFVAGSARLPKEIQEESSTADPAFLNCLRSSVATLLGNGGPIDCTPKGLRRCGVCALCTQPDAVWSTRRAQRCARFGGEGDEDEQDEAEVLEDVNC